MFDLPKFTSKEKVAPGRVADWSLTVTPDEPGLAAELAGKPPFLSVDPGALAGAAVGALVGALTGTAKPPPLMRFDRSGYLARIDADAQAGLNGGGLTFTLLRARESDHAKLAAAKSACDEDDVALVARLSLGWNRPEGILGLLGPGGGDLTEVGVFAIVDIAPAVDGVSYSIALKGRDRILRRLSTRRVFKASTAATPEAAAGALLDLLGVADWRQATEDPVPPPAEQPEVKLDLGADGLSELGRLGRMIETAGHRLGREPYLIRGGVLQVGVGRAIPFRGNGAEGKVIQVSVASGLIGYAELDPVPKDPNFSFRDAVAVNPDPVEPKRRRFRLDLMGSPEIAPGDVVAFPPAADPFAAASLAANLVPALALAGGEDWDSAISLYVASVSHRIDLNSGFLTTITGVEVDAMSPAPDAFWDVPSEAPARAVPKTAEATDDGTPEGAMAASVAQHVAREMRRYAPPDVGEVTATTAGTGGAAERPLASSVVVGVSDSPDQARRSVANPVFRAGQAAADSVPYVTPFAWGPFGLVLPRYPGTRVMLLHGHGDAADPVDIGALWHGPAADTAAHPSKAEAGDWWLKLPASVTPAAPDAVLAGPVAPPADAKAVNDLTDAKGVRIIEVGQLVIRVGQTALGAADARPDAAGAAEASVVIEQKDGGGVITIDKAGKVTIKATDVLVEVSGTMDVRKA